MGEMVDLSSHTTGNGGSRRLSAYVTRPSGDDPLPGVVLVHEAFGLDATMKKVADHVAALGYVVAAPDLFSDGGALRCLRATFASLRTGHGRAFSDVETARTWLLARGDTTDGTGVIGFCMGGAFALLLAAPGRGFDVSSVNYGFLPPDPQVLRGACPIVASYGGDDKQLADVPDKLERALTAYDVPHDVTSYPGAGHSFLNPEPNGPWALRPLLKVTGVGPRPEQAAEAWGRIAEFFATYLPR